MPYHGIYIKTRPNKAAKWHLVSVTTSPETATIDVAAILKQAELEDNEKVQACIQVFDSMFHIPEFLSEIKEYKLLYN